MVYGLKEHMNSSNLVQIKEKRNKEFFLSKQSEPMYKFIKSSIVTILNETNKFNFCK